MGNKYIANPVTLGEQLRNRRLELGLLQKDVARIIVVTEDSITNWEKNRSKPMKRYHSKILAFLK